MVTIKIKENTKQAKAIISYLQTLFFIEFLDDKSPNKVTINAINDTKKANVYKSKNIDDLMSHLNS